MTRDQFLAEMMGMCWHELPIQAPYHECIKCGRRMPWWNPNFSTPADAYRLMQFVMAQEWWKIFIDGQLVCFVANYPNYSSDAGAFVKYLITNLPDLVAEYRGFKP